MKNMRETSGNLVEACWERRQLGRIATVLLLLSIKLISRGDSNEAKDFYNSRSSDNCGDVAWRSMGSSVNTFHVAGQCAGLGKFEKLCWRSGCQCVCWVPRVPWVAKCQCSRDTCSSCLGSAERAVWEIPDASAVPQAVCTFAVSSGCGTILAQESGFFGELYTEQ